MATDVETYTTDQVSEMTGVTSRTLRDWQRDGRVSPPADGAGRARRIAWRPEDVDVVKALAAGSNGAMTREAHEAVGCLLPHLTAGRVRADLVTTDQVVVISERGVRVLRDSDTLGELRRRCGDGNILVMAVSSPDDQA